MSFVARQLPTTEELRNQLLQDHRKKSTVHRKNGILTTFCAECVTSPRSLILALELVKTDGPLIRDLYDDLSPERQNAFDHAQAQGGESEMVLVLSWCIREDDHVHAAQRDDFVSHAERYLNTELNMEALLDLTFLPGYDEGDLLIARHEMRSSMDRPYASRKWQRRGLSRPQGKLTTQEFWIASGVPLAQRLRTTVKGRKWASYAKDPDPIPDTLWSAIIDLWRARYPQRGLPSPAALRRRLSQHLPA